MPGELVDVGGYKMHINCTGQGSPTVILDSGLGDPFNVWFKVQPQISQFVRVCSYDRAGLGYSDSGPHPPLSKDIAEELHALLHNAGIPAPVILVGHSMGGLNVRLYASLYRTEIAGMVLVDSSHPDQKKRIPAALRNLEAIQEAGFVRELRFEEFGMLFGLPRLLNFFDPFDYCHTDAASRATMCNFQTVRTGISAMKTFDASAAQAAVTGALGDMPLAVLSHDPDAPQPGIPADLLNPTNAAFDQMQEELAHLSTRGTRIVARNSSHYIQLDRPDLVIDAVRRVVAEARQSTSVAQPAP